MLVARKVSCHVANAFWTRLKLVWPIFSLEISKMSKKGVFGQKICRRQRVKRRGLARDMRAVLARRKCDSLLFEVPRFSSFVTAQEERLTSAADTEFKLWLTIQIIQRLCRRVRRRPEESTSVLLITIIISFVQI